MVPKPDEKLRVYDLVSTVGIDVSNWADFEGEHPASNPQYCYNWAFFDQQRQLAVICLWHAEMRTDEQGIFQEGNYREINAARRSWNPNQRKRAGEMDRALQFVNNRHVPFRVIIVDGSRRGDSNDQSRSKVEHRCLDPEPWHVAAYTNDGKCLLRRGPLVAPTVEIPPPPQSETFTPEEILASATFAEGATKEITFRVRERSARLRDLARAHFTAQSPDGRLRCAACNWAPPVTLHLSGPIVEIHHGIGIYNYPTDGKSLTFEDAISHLTPLCPNCHRVTHARSDGGIYDLTEVRAAYAISREQA